jgi:hypothetical protein
MGSLKAPLRIKLTTGLSNPLGASNLRPAVPAEFFDIVLGRFFLPISRLEQISKTRRSRASVGSRRRLSGPSASTAQRSTRWRSSGQHGAPRPQPTTWDSPSHWQWRTSDTASDSAWQRGHGAISAKVFVRARLQLGVSFRRRPLSLWPRCRCPSGPASPAFSRAAGANRFTFLLAECGGN